MLTAATSVSAEDPAKAENPHVNDDIHEISYTDSSDVTDALFNENDSKEEIREIYYNTPGREKNLRYENARSDHHIAVDPEEIRRKLGDTDEIESAIINEAIHLTDEYDYEGPVTEDLYTEPYERYDRYDRNRKDDSTQSRNESFKSRDVSVSEYMKPSVSVDESSYSSSSARTASPRKTHPRRRYCL